jgi:carboxyl-terminal processing protease
MDNKTRKIVIWMPVLLTLFVIAGIFVGVKLQNRIQSGSRIMSGNSTNKVGVILSLIEGDYVDSIDTKKIVESAIPEILKQLDPHTVYIPAKDMQEVTEEMAGNFSGIGVQFSIQ